MPVWIRSSFCHASYPALCNHAAIYISLSANVRPVAGNDCTDWNVTELKSNWVWSIQWLQWPKRELKGVSNNHSSSAASVKPTVSSSAKQVSESGTSKQWLTQEWSVACLLAIMSQAPFQADCKMSTITSRSWESAADTGGRVLCSGNNRNLLNDSKVWCQKE